MTEAKFNSTKLNNELLLTFYSVLAACSTDIKNKSQCLPSESLLPTEDNTYPFVQLLSTEGLLYALGDWDAGK